MRQVLNLTFFFTFFNFLFAQNYAVTDIAPEIRDNAYAVFRLNETTVDFQAQNRLRIKREMVITVLKEAGNIYANYPIYYDKSTRINKTSATIYDAQGKKIKELKEKDLKDESAVDGFSMYLDDRLKYYDYTPTSLPYTIHYVFETTTANTVFFPKWNPVTNYEIGVEVSRYNLINSSKLKVRKKEKGFEFWDVIKSEQNNVLTYEARNIPPIKDEIMSPDLDEIMPKVIFAPNEFELEGVKGSFDNWTDFGKWYLDNLLKGKQDLSESEKKQVRALVDGISNPAEKVQILYEYLQNKTRYINISIGIGGWKPYPASYVNSKSYGDCKALSNYMMSILEAVGIEAFYTIVHANNNKKVDIDKDFAYMHGNHIIINVPNGDETIWLECTSQQSAFNFLGRFTDDRYALAITPEGGKIVSTQKFPDEKNLELITGLVTITSDGNMKANLDVTYKGLQYDVIYPIYYENSTSQNQIFKRYLDNLPNLTIKDYKIENNQDLAEFNMQFDLESKQYAKPIGNDLIVNLILRPTSENSLKKDDNRKYPFEIRYGFKDVLEYEIKIPSNYQMQGKFEPIQYDSEFGTYQLEVIQKDPNTLLVKKSLLIKDGNYPKEKFNTYVDFRRKINSYETSKILLEKK